MEKLGAAVRAAREQRRMQAQDLADALGKSQGYVSKIETGNRKEMIGPDDLNALAGAIGIPVADLLRKAGYAIDAAAHPDSDDFLELKGLLATLPPAERQMVLKFARWRRDETARGS